MNRPDDSKLPGLLAGAFVLLTVPRLLLHELWRDEAWLWLVAAGSGSLAELWQQLGRSGQGYLFSLLCHAAAQVTKSPLAMQAIHLLLAGAAAFAFARWAPLERRERALFLLGYFPFYEYAVISRHYVAGALLAWLACIAARGRRPAVALGLWLGLLCQTTVYGFILALAILCGWLLDRRLRRAEVPPVPRSEAAAGVALGLAGAVAGIVQLVPSPGTSFAPAWRLGWDPAHALKVMMTPWRAFVPVPRPGLNFWNTNLLDAWPNLEAVAGLLVLAAALVFLWRRKVALAVFAIGGSGLLAFGYLKLVGELRHHGHWWLLFAAAIWLGGGLQVDRRSWRSLAFLVLLIVHVAAGLYASAVDLRHPFSNGPATAELIRSEGLDRHPLFGHREPPAASVALPLGRPLYAPSRELYTTHPDWGPRQRELTPQEVRCAARDLARKEGRDVVLVMNWELPPWEEVEPIGSTRGAIEESEDYRLYWLRHGRLEAWSGAAECR